jgi:hypothetical protein
VQRETESFWFYMKSKASNKLLKEQEEFIENVDYYFENGLMVLTARFLLKRGYCCRNNCRNCPYTISANKNLQQKGF